MFDTAPAAKPPSDLPQARCFNDIGLACMHSDLAEKERNVHFMMRSCPYGSTSHGYADQNAFILHAYGEPLAIASGYYPWYASPHHKNWTWETKATNSLLVDGEGQKVRSWDSKGRIVQFATTDYAHYAWGDAHLAYPDRLKRFDRHALYLRPVVAGDEPVIILWDHIEAVKPATYQWLLHALEQMDVDTANEVVTIKHNAARLAVRFLAPQGLQLTQTDQFTVPPEADFNKLGNQWHLTAATAQPSATQSFVTVLLPYHADGEQSLPTTRLLNVEGCIALEIKSPRSRQLAFFRTTAPQGTPLRFEGLETSADVFAALSDPQNKRLAEFTVNWRDGGG